jgi:hypothetical protein
MLNCSAIYREIDRNYDDQISFDELFLFLFPDHDEALAREIKRLKIVGDRVRSHGKLHGHHIEEESDNEGSVGSAMSPSYNPAEARIMAESGSYKVTNFQEDPDQKSTGRHANKIVLAPISATSQH